MSACKQNLTDKLKESNSKAKKLAETANKALDSNKPVYKELEIKNFIPLQLVTEEPMHVKVYGRHVGRTMRIEPGNWIFNEMKKLVGEYSTTRGWTKTHKEWRIVAERTDLSKANIEEKEEE